MSDACQENKIIVQEQKQSYEIAYDGFLTHPLDPNYEAHKLINDVLIEAFEYKHPTEVFFAWSDLKLKKISIC